MIEMRIKPSMSMFLSHEEFLKSQKEWYQEYALILAGLVNDFVDEYCERDRLDGSPLPVEGQTCEVVSNAINFLSAQ
jgi:hypothetical protein